MLMQLLHNTSPARMDTLTFRNSKLEIRNSSWKGKFAHIFHGRERGRNFDLRIATCELSSCPIKNFKSREKNQCPTKISPAGIQMKRKIYNTYPGLTKKTANPCARLLKSYTLCLFGAGL